MYDLYSHYQFLELIVFYDTFYTCSIDAGRFKSSSGRPRRYIDISTIYSTICIDTSLEGFYENKFVLYSNITDCQLSVTS